MQLRRGCKRPPCRSTGFSTDEGSLTGTKKNFKWVQPSPNYLCPEGYMEENVEIKRKVVKQSKKTELRRAGELYSWTHIFSVKMHNSFKGVKTCIRTEIATRISYWTNCLLYIVCLYCALLRTLAKVNLTTPELSVAEREEGPRFKCTHSNKQQRCV